MSRKQRVEKRSERREQQRRALLIGGVVVTVVVIVVVALMVIADTRNREQQDATATAAAAVTQKWDAPPAMAIDPENKTYQARFVTEKGDILVDLLADEAPVTVNNFVFLAREGFYDNTTFHRVIEGFMAQGGDPTGTGSGGPGYQFADETDNGLIFDQGGLLAMANSGTNTNGSQFFITYAPADWLNGLHTIFGRVVEGMDVAESLTPRDPDTNPNYLGDTLVTVEIIEADKPES